MSLEADVYAGDSRLRLSMLRSDCFRSYVASFIQRRHFRIITTFKATCVTCTTFVFLRDSLINYLIDNVVIWSIKNLLLVRIDICTRQGKLAFRNGTKQSRSCGKAVYSQSSVVHFASSSI